MQGRAIGFQIRHAIVPPKWSQLRLRLMLDLSDRTATGTSSMLSSAAEQMEDNTGISRQLIMRRRVSKKIGGWTVVVILKLFLAASFSFCPTSIAFCCVPRLHVKRQRQLAS